MRFVSQPASMDKFCPSPLGGWMLTADIGKDTYPIWASYEAAAAEEKPVNQ